MDSILGHCILRAVLHERGGVEAVIEKYEATGERLSNWSVLRAAAKATPKASRVATFVICWAIAMADEGTDEFSITEYQRYWNESERQAYRLQKEFRQLWPEFETPNELGRQIVKHVDAKIAKWDVARLPTTLQVAA